MGTRSGFRMKLDGIDAAFSKPQSFEGSVIEAFEGLCRARGQRISIHGIVMVL
jgi:hypothetical protein